MDADVIIVGAGPTGLMLAGELGRAGVGPLVLERQAQIRDLPKAGGLSGQILEVLRYRGELKRFEAASTAPRPAPRFPWGGMHVDFTQLADPPMQALPLPQPRLERVLDEFARELGAEIRRGQEVVGLSQDNAKVTADVRGPDGPDRVTARYLVGCDGSDIRYPLPGHDHHHLIGTFAPDLTLRADRGATSVAELMHTARPVFLDLADRSDLRETARDWGRRIDIHAAETDDRPADALLIRPDAHVAWAAIIDEPTDTAAPALREALSRWFGSS